MGAHLPAITSFNEGTSESPWKIELKDVHLDAKFVDIDK